MFVKSACSRAARLLHYESFMSTTAPSASEPETQSESRSVPASKRQGAAEPRAARGRRPRAKKATIVAHPQHAQPHSDSNAVGGLVSSPPPREKTQFGTLLVGAGIGAAVTLSVVALGSKRGRGSVFALAITKSLSYAIARTTERGSLINIMAQAVGSAIA